MSKRILVSIACLGIVWILGANAERLFAEDDAAVPDGVIIESSTNRPLTPTPQVEPQLPVELQSDLQRPEPNDPFGDAARRDGEMGAGGMPMGSMGGVMGMGRGGRFGGRSGPGTFTVITGGAQPILLNETTGESWLLIDDQEPPHWKPIAMGVNKGGKTEISGPATSSGESLEQLRKSEQLRKQEEQDSDRQVNNLTNDRSRLEGQLRHLSDELSKSKRRELKLEAALRSFEKLQIQNEEEEVEEKKDVEENGATSKENPFGGF